MRAAEDLEYNKITGKRTDGNAKGEIKEHKLFGTRRTRPNEVKRSAEREVKGKAPEKNERKRPAAISFPRPLFPGLYFLLFPSRGVSKMHAVRRAVYIQLKDEIFLFVISRATKL